MPKPNEQIGSYTLIRKLGGGQFGTVWLAEKRGLITTQVAIKFVNDDKADFEKVKKEAEVWAKANGNTNVSSIFDAEIFDEQIILISEYALDGSLAEWLKKRNGIAPSIETAIKMVCGILSGLAHLHSKQIIHRDVKPANILLYGEIPKLTDFGISRVIRSTAAANQSLVAGTPAYMSPEAYENKRDIRTDIWSVGVILYQMLTGRLPFVAADAYTMMMAILTQTPTPLPDEIPNLLKEIIFHALEKDPNKRYQSAQEMKQALEVALIELGKPKIKLETYEFQTVEVNNSGRLTRQLSSSARFFIENLGEGIGLELVEIAGNDFIMGSSETEVGRLEDEEPQHQISIARFFIGKFPITQSQWQAIMKSEPSHFKGDNLPVEQVSWYDAVNFCRFLSEKTGKEYRLPSEAEWEYAARAKTETPFGLGYTITPEQVNYDGNYPYLFMIKDVYRAKTTTVGSLAVANGFGLYDMHGNVYEWCQDIYHNNYKGIPTDGHPWESGGDANYRVIRGGSWSSDAVFCRSAARGRKKTDLTSNNVGFRVACSLRS